jgi:hypothetical protein
MANMCSAIERASQGDVFAGDMFAASAPTVYDVLDAVVLTDMEVVCAAGLNLLCFGLAKLLFETGQAWVGMLECRELLVTQCCQVP